LKVEVDNWNEMPQKRPDMREPLTD